MTWETMQYKALICRILDEGVVKKTRNGETKSIFGEMMEVDLSTGYFPIVQDRRIYYKPVLGELAAFFKGPKTGEDFTKYGCNYWKDWVDKDGRISIDYGNAWRDFNGVDQLAMLVETIKKDPNNRRMLISGWNPGNLSSLSLPCCHMLYQWYVSNGKLDMIWYQRSVDVMVGLPSDIILAAAWNIILAMECGLKPGKVKFMLGDTHIYMNHIDGVKKYLEAFCEHAPPRYQVLLGTSVFNFEPDMLKIVDYQHEAPIKFELNV